MSTLASRRDDYTTLCDGIRRLTGIDLHQYKRGQMERRIRTFAEKKGIKDLGEYLRVLERDRALVDELLDRVTINVSQLWRNPEQWTLLATKILPELAAEGGRVRAWSAGSSYGAEAFTLAAVASSVVKNASRARATMRRSMSVPRICVVARGATSWQVAASVNASAP